MSGSRSQAARTRLGLPDDFRVYSAFPFKGVNQSGSRIAIDDSEFYWLENLIRIGDGNLRTLWDAGEALYTASVPGSILPLVTWFNIGPQSYTAIFLTDGTAVQVYEPAPGVIVETPISTTPNTFYNAAVSTQLPATVQYGSRYLIIANHNTNDDYWIWDGALLYSPGGIAPISDSTITDGGTGYTAVPTYTVYGGSGSGVVLTPVVFDGSVVSLTVTNPGTGYLPGDIVQVAFSGGGTNDSAILRANIVAGVVQFLTLIDGGSEYPSGSYALGITGGGGTGATGTFIASGGSVTSVTLTGGGSGYTGAPVISYPIPGSGGAITATASGGAVNTLTVSNPGSGYVPGTYPLVFSGGGGAGASATYTVGGGGTIVSTDILAGGADYVFPPTVSIPKGFGAETVATITPGAVDTITVVNGGTGYQGTPTLTITGGGGTGATATATVSGGVIVSVAVTLGGTGYTRAPAIVIETGVNNAAAAILALMPFGVSGTSIETYQQRVWISYPNEVGQQNNGGKFLVSAPGSLTDFATSDGGDIFNNTDRFLRAQYTFLRQTSNFLYPTGDSSVSVISNVQTSGTPATTTFSYQNSDPQIGSPWRDTAQDYANTILFGNPFGIYGIYGGSVRKVSAKIDEIFNAAIFPPTTGALVPTAAVANIYSQKVYLQLMTITDPFSQAHRNVMVGWTERDWFIASQTPALTAIGTQEVNSDLTAWGTDGTSLYPLFQTPTTNIFKIVATKLWGGAESFIINMTHSVYIDAVDRSAAQTGISFVTATIDGDGLAVPAQNSLTQKVSSAPSTSVKFDFTPTFLAPYPFGAMYATGRQPQVPGVALGMTLISNSEDFSLRNISLGVIEYSAVA